MYPGLYQQGGGHQNEGGHCPSLVSLQSCIGIALTHISMCNILAHGLVDLDEVLTDPPL